MKYLGFVCRCDEGRGTGNKQIPLIATDRYVCLCSATDWITIAKAEEAGAEVRSSSL